MKDNNDTIRLHVETSLISVGDSRMPFKIIRDDITKISVDVIVNAANKSLLGGGGVDGAIHNAAGPQLRQECLTLDGCHVGQAKITKGYNLPASYVIHTVGPIWEGGNHNEEHLLRECYRNSLALAKEYNFESIAFPLISTGAYGFPKDKALSISNSVIGEFLLENDMDVYLVVFDTASFMLSSKLFATIEQYIDDRYLKGYVFNTTQERKRLESLEESKDLIMYSLSYESVEDPSKRSLDDVINNIDETFSLMLLRLIAEKNLEESQVYKRANIDRKLFSKIRNNVDYKPSKPTVLAFAIALKLNLDETKDLLKRAGFALSNSSKFDIIIEYFIENENFDVFEINQALFDFEQNLLGL